LEFSLLALYLLIPLEATVLLALDMGVTEGDFTQGFTTESGNENLNPKVLF
jgi:hypothetical protein